MRFWRAAGGLLVVMGFAGACANNGDTTEDASTDAPQGDATSEASTDTGVDAKKDVATDAPSDAPTDTQDDTADAIDESVADTGTDVVDAGVDVVTDAGGCSSNTDCLSTEYCEKGTGNCGGTGTCMVRPKFCPLIYAPVCGCDKMTYTNACYAHRSGQSEAYGGVCE